MSQDLQQATTSRSPYARGSPRASRGSLQQPPRHQQSTYVASFEPLPRSLVAPGPIDTSLAENVTPDQHRQSSQYEGFHIPPTANLPPLDGTGPSTNTNLLPPFVPSRRSSMQEASTEFLYATYPQAFHLPLQHAPFRPESPRTYITPRMRLRPGNSKGKDRALEPYHPAPPLHPVPPAGEVVGPCR